VFEEIKLQLEGAREELEEIERSTEWFVSITPERINDLLETLRKIEKGEPL
jgi:hypothetical protein